MICRNNKKLDLEIQFEVPNLVFDMEIQFGDSNSSVLNYFA